MPVLAKRRKRKVLFRVYQNLSDINHITHRQFNLLIVVIMFHPIIGVRFGLDAIGQTVMVSQVERHTEWEVITDTAAQCRPLRWDNPTPRTSRLLDYPCRSDHLKRGLHLSVRPVKYAASFLP